MDPGSGAHRGRDAELPDPDGTALRGQVLGAMQFALAVLAFAGAGFHALLRSPASPVLWGNLGVGACLLAARWAGRRGWRAASAHITGATLLLYPLVVAGGGWVSAGTPVNLTFLWAVPVLFLCSWLYSVRTTAFIAAAYLGVILAFPIVFPWVDRAGATNSAAFFAAMALISLHLAGLRERAGRRLRAQAEDLRERGDRLRSIFEAAFEGLAVVRDGIVVDTNPAFDRTMGAHRRDGPLANLVPAAGRAALQARLERMAGGYFECEAFAADGSVIPVECAIKAHGYRGEQVVVVALRDISERRREELLRAEFMDSVSHELRTPLTAIHGSLATLSEADLAALDPRDRQLIEIARSGSARLRRLVNDLLDLRRIETGGITLEIAPVVAADLVDEAVETCRQLAADGQVTVEATVAPDLALAADAYRVEQALINLLSNAIKFSPAGSRVAVRAEGAGPHVKFAVSDQGPGIDPELRTRIFRRFSRAADADRGRQAGSGLGLAIAKAIVDAHGGEIGFESLVGGGATFFILLPGGAGPEIGPAPRHAAADAGVR